MKLADVAVVKGEDGSEVELNTWFDEEGKQTMYVRPQEVPFCQEHTFNKQHECTKCPYIFTGFRGHMHIQKDNGIYERASMKRIV